MTTPLIAVTMGDGAGVGPEVIAGALRAYDEGVKGKSFPGEDNSVHIEENLISKAEDYLDGLFDAFFDDDSAIDN